MITSQLDPLLLTKYGSKAYDISIEFPENNLDEQILDASVSQWYAPYWRYFNINAIKTEITYKIKRDYSERTIYIYNNADNGEYIEHLNSILIRDAEDKLFSRAVDTISLLLNTNLSLLKRVVDKQLKCSIGERIKNFFATLFSSSKKKVKDEDIYNALEKYYRP